MAFQRSYSKVWWGSDNNQLSSTVSGTSFTSGGFYSYYNNNGNTNNSRSSSTNSTNSISSHNNGNQSQQQTEELAQAQAHAQAQEVELHQQQFRFGSGSDYHSLDLHNYKANLSCIQEVDDEQNSSKLSWQKHNSPGSLRSQDSGFSDNDDTHSTRSPSGRSAATKRNASPSTNSDNNSMGTPSPISTRSIATPPTVIRRVGKSAFYSPLVSVTRRISFGAGANSPNETLTETNASMSGDDGNDFNANDGGDDDELDNNRISDIENATFDENTSKLFAELDSMHLSTATPKKQHNETNFDKMIAADAHPSIPPKPLVRRRKRVLRKQPLAAVALSSDIDESLVNNNIPAYNNETVFLGEAPPPYNNETVVFGERDSIPSNDDHHSVAVGTVEQPHGDADDDNNNTLKLELSPIRSRFTASTSTPNAKAATHRTRPQYIGSMDGLDLNYPIYDNPLLNGHMPAVQGWLSDLRISYDHEVMSTLQTKSISQEAFRNFTITTNSVTKLIRQLQQRSLDLQSEFETTERMLMGTQAVTLQEALSTAEHLIAHVGEFTKVLERRAIFFQDSRTDRRKYEDHLEQIRIVTKDTRYSLERQHYINLESLLDDVQVLKRNLLITIRLIFEKMVRIIVQSIENSRSDMLLGANINMIVTLTNIDYDGFGSLTDAFVQNEAVRALLIVVLDHKSTSVRALALRALTTICSAPEAIVQLGLCGGIEIVRDILLAANAESSGDVERREAVSLLVQITADWHGPSHYVDGLKDCAESIVAGLAELITPDCCSPTLLLCAASLNNLSRMEATSHYSIMSNEAIFKLIASVEDRVTEVSVFLDEQIVSMLHNMSLNKKCHSHLANGIIINFITSVYQTEFYKKYGSRAESQAQQRCIKAILHTLTRLVQDTNCPTLSAELVEQWRLPEFFMLANSGVSAAMGTTSTTLDNSVVYTRDISQLARQLLHAHQQEQLLLQAAPGSVLVSSGNQTPEAQTRTTKTNKETGPAPTASPTTTTKTSSLGSSSCLKFNLTRQESFV